LSVSRTAVPRFFFHLYDDIVALDEEGIELPGVQTARERAIASAKAIACAEVLEGHLNLKHRIDIAKEGGEVVATVRFRDAIELVG
jgi:hypothetical protein